jgi:hypothetical protein
MMPEVGTVAELIIVHHCEKGICDWLVVLDFGSPMCLKYKNSLSLSARISF